MHGKTLKFLDQYRFALVGFSRSGRKFGNYIYRKLTARGMHIYPINPTGGVVNGVKTYKSLEELPVKPQAAILAVKASSVEAAVHDVIEAGIKRVWIIGSGYTKKAERLCRDNGIEIIHNRCILMYFGGFPHNLHYLAHRIWRGEAKLNPACAMYDALGEWVSFRSDADGSDQQFWLGLPEKFNPDIRCPMAMYLHQQGSDWSGVLTSGMYRFCRRKGIISVSTDYRGHDSHLNSVALSDVRQIIGTMIADYAIPAWIAAGVSMGAVSSIQLTYLLPVQVRPGAVVAVLPIYDIPRFLANASEGYRKALVKSYGGTPETNPDEYAGRSPHLNVGNVDPAIPFAIFAGKRDDIVPADEHGRPLAEALKRNGNPVLYREVDIGHDPEVFSGCYREGLEFALGKMDISAPEKAAFQATGGIRGNG